MSEKWYDLLFTGNGDSLLYFITAFNYKQGGTPFLLKDLLADANMDWYLLANRMIDKADENDDVIKQWRALSQEQKLDFIIQYMPQYLITIQNPKS